MEAFTIPRLGDKDEMSGCALRYRGPVLAPCVASYHHHRSLAHSKVSLPVPYDTPMPGLTFPAYFALSSSLTALAVSYAFQSRSQFYPAVIYLVTSKLSVLVLGNMGLMLTLLAGRIMKSVFLGQLRGVEVELLYDNARYAVTETCLALTIFREELTVRVLTLFTALLFSKSFHWLCQSRVEYVESDNVPRWTHIRLLTLMYTLLLWDVAFVAGCVYFWKGPSVLILFGFEYTILAVSVTSTLLRYCLHLIDMRIEGNWPQKGSYIFFLEFATEVVRFLSYVVFFSIIFTYYGMPLHIVRDLWMSYVNLKRRLVIFNKYRHLTANMNERFPDATPEELVACEHTCIICRDLMEAGPGAKRLPCAHIFHLDCLRLWLQQQQSCPTCRADIPTTATPPAGTPAAQAPVEDGGVAAAAAAAAAGQGGAEAGDEVQQGVLGGVHAAAPPNAGQPAAPRQQQQRLQQQERQLPRLVDWHRAGGAMPHHAEPAGAAAAGGAGGGPGLMRGAVGTGFAPPLNFPHPPTTVNGSAFPPHPSFPHPPTTPAFAGIGGNGGMHSHFLPSPYAGFPPMLPPGALDAGTVAGGGGSSVFQTTAYQPVPMLFGGGMGPAGVFGPGLRWGGGEMGGSDFAERPFVLYRVVSRAGAVVRASRNPASQTLRLHRQHEMIIILERAAASEQSGGMVVYRVLGGGFIHEQEQQQQQNTGARSSSCSNNSGTILEAMPSPPPMPLGMAGFLPPFFSPPNPSFSSCSNSNSNSSATGAGIGGAGGLSRSLVSLRLDLNEAKAGVDSMVEGWAVLLAKQQVEMQRFQRVMARLEQAHEDIATQATAAAAAAAAVAGCGPGSAQESGTGGEEGGLGGGGEVAEGKGAGAKREVVQAQAPAVVERG